MDKGPEPCVVAAARLGSVVFQAGQVRFKQHALVDDESGRPVWIDASGQVELDREVEEDVSRPCDRLVDPAKRRGSPGDGETLHIARRPGAAVLTLSRDQAIALQASQQSVQVAGAKVQDVAQSRVGCETPRQIVAMAGAV
jgi:hypothetical protein